MNRATGTLVLCLWALAVILSLIGFGALLDESASGIVVEQRSFGLALAALAALVLAVVSTVAWARGLDTGESDGAPPRPGRRRFLVGGASTLGGLLAVGAAALVRPLRWITVTGTAMGPPAPTVAPRADTSWSGARVRAYRTLGRTGAQISDISLGSTRIRGEDGERIAREAIERGVNYFDTAPDYAQTGSERALGRAMKGVRDQMFVATKFCTPHGHLQAGASVQQYMQTVEGSLKRLLTDRVDLVHVHACNSLERMRDPNMREAFERLKEQGKVRFLGFSSHTPNLESVADAAIDDGHIDVMMLAYHHGAWPRLPEIIDRAAAAGVGVVAMKTLKGARHRGLLDLRPEADSYTQAAFKWVLGNPSVSGLVISFHQPQHLDEYLHASGGTLTEADLAVLEKYDRLIAGRHCFQHCGGCLDSCPEGLAIDDVLRHRMYFEDYGDEKAAMQLYAALDRTADACIGCAAPCAGSCPYGVPIQERTIGAHRLLSQG